MTVTDPPYGVDYDPGWRNKAGAAATRRTGKVLNDDRADWREAWALFPGDVAYVWHGAPLARRNAGLDPLFFKGFAIPVRVMAAICEPVFGGRQFAQQGPCTDVIAALPGGQEHPQRAPAIYKTTTWPACNEALKRLGSLTIWFDPGMTWPGMIWDAVPTAPPA